MTLGALIEALEALPQDRLIVGPGEPMSYRGYYSDLAFEPDETPRLVADALASARGCMGQVFEGYKGGDFMMGATTPIWSAEYGRAFCPRIMGMNTDVDPITLVLAPEDDDA